jgi:oligopeptidase B
MTRLALLPLVLLAAASSASGQQPPVAENRPFEVVSPHGTRNDPYYWLRDDSRSNPEVLAHLRAEQAYFESGSSRYSGLTETIYGEILGRLKQDDNTVPYKLKGYLYYRRFEPGRQYPIYARRPLDSDREQILVDANREAEGREYYRVGNWAVSPQGDLVAFLEDTHGRYQNTLRVREIATGRDLPDRIDGLSSSLAWGADNRTLYYIENDPVTLLTTRVKRHVLGTDPKSDPVIYEEKDTSFYIDVSRSGDERFVVIALDSTVSSEDWVLDLADPTGALRLLAPRERGVRYESDHIAGRWIVSTDWNAPNFRLMSVPDAEIGDRARWRELVPHDPVVFIEDFVLFTDHLVINERSEGLLRLRVVPWLKPEGSSFIRSDEPAYTARLGVNAEQATTKLRYTYTSLTTPTTTYEVDLKTGAHLGFKVADMSRCKWTSPKIRPPSASSA